MTGSEGLIAVPIVEHDMKSCFQIISLKIANVPNFIELQQTMLLEHRLQIWEIDIDSYDTNGSDQGDYFIQQNMD